MYLFVIGNVNELMYAHELMMNYSVRIKNNGNSQQEFLIGI